MTYTPPQIWRLETLSASVELVELRENDIIGMCWIPHGGPPCTMIMSHVRGLVPIFVRCRLYLCHGWRGRFKCSYCASRVHRRWQRVKYMYLSVMPFLAVTISSAGRLPGALLCKEFKTNSFLNHPTTALNSSPRLIPFSMALYSRHPRFTIALLILVFISVLLFANSEPDDSLFGSVGIHRLGGNYLAESLRIEEEHYQKMLDLRQDLVRKWGPTADKIDP